MGKEAHFTGRADYGQFFIRDPVVSDWPTWQTGQEPFVAGPSSLLLHCLDPIFGNIEVTVHTDGFDASKPISEIARCTLAIESGQLAIETVGTVGRSSPDEIQDVIPGNYSVRIYAEVPAEDGQDASRFYILLGRV